MFWFILLSALFINPINDNNDKPFTYHGVKAKNGDGVYSFLRRYDLDHPKCNVVKFYEMNEMAPKDHLISGKEYKLPVYIYNYNGKSIRSTIGKNNMDVALEIKEYNDNLYAKKRRSTKYTDSKILWVPHNTMHCEESSKNTNESVIVESTKSSAKTSTLSSESLFGNKHSKFEMIDNSLKNQVYYVVAGHGGLDPGAMCYSCPTDLCEDEYAYDVALRLARDLMQHGAIVEVIVQDKNDGIRDDLYLKCDRDEVYRGNLKISDNQKLRLRKRAAIINELHAKYKKQGIKTQKAVMIHIDSQNKNKRQDVFFFHAKGSNAGKALAKNIMNTFDEKYAKYQKNRGYKGFVRKKNLYMLNYTNPPAVFIELGNIRNKEDHKRFIYESNRQALANWIFEGLIK